MIDSGKPIGLNGQPPHPATWLVTGGSRGIGRAIALHAASRGSNVVICAHRSIAEAEAVVREAEQAGGRALAVAADVRHEADVRRLFDAAQAAFGSPDVVVCNAGASQARMLVNVSDADWEVVVGTNLSGAFLTAREALRAFRSNGRAGRIVLIGSPTQLGAPSNTVYAASKGGLIGLLSNLTHHSGVSGAQASMVVVGFVETALTRELSGEDWQRIQRQCPLRRPADSAEVAEAVWFLAGAGAAAFHGQVLHVSGGLREVPV